MIRAIGLSDLEHLQAIGRKTFSETFSSSNTAKDMEQYLREEFTTEKLTAELTNAESRFYFAEMDARPIGYLKVNFGHAQTELRDERAMEIERIYVLNAYQSQGVGRLLHDKAIAIA